MMPGSWRLSKDHLMEHRTAADKDLLQARSVPASASDPYQLLLRKALQPLRVNLMIGDDVGLGKTVEAGLVLRELPQAACPVRAGGSAAFDDAAVEGRTGS